MPPRPKFTKQEIVAAGLKVARERGMEAVSTRDIAAVLGVSTRPIFTYFRSMDELKAEVYQEAEEIYRGYVQEGLKEKVPFLGVGMQYIRFAKEEPQLYRMLFLSPPVKGYNSHEQNSTYSLFMHVCEAWQPLLSLQIYSNNQLQMV